ncbi:MAG: type II toxin-antitoxin system death-on-curing family toxin [Pirellulales bacterium]|nr:type II toxin-antitoxin system death-on-curing family toxin [Pirellulales bacterium]
MAGAYLYHLVLNRPFVDGNNRVGAVAAIVFLELNDLRVKVAHDDYAELVLSTARGEISKSAIAEFMRAYLNPR